MTVVGVVGVGLMGSACTRRLTAAGFKVVAYDVDSAKRAAAQRLGARPMDSLADLVAAAGTIILAVFNTDQVEDVMEGPAGMASISANDRVPRTVISTSTCDPDRLGALVRRVADRGVRLLEVPISGTSRQVEEGAGVGLVGGDRSVMEELGPVLDAVCPRRYYLGEAGNGSRAKLAVNLILGLNRAALAEGLVLAESLGLDRAAFLEVARGSAAYSQVMDVKGPLMARRQYGAPQSRVDQSLKDFRLILEQARSRGQALPLAGDYVRLLEDCVAHGEAEWDNAAIAEAIKRAAVRPAK